MTGATSQGQPSPLRLSQETVEQESGRPNPLDEEDYLAEPDPSERSRTMSTSADYRTVSRAIQFLDDHFTNQPSLEDLALEMGMSRFHLQRLFTRWAGVSPKRFLQFLTLEHAKELLDQSEPVLATAFAAGLSGPARLHDLFVTAEGVTPGEYKTGGFDLDICYGFHATPFGQAILGTTERGLCHLAFLPFDDPDGSSQAVEDLSENWPGAHLTEGEEATAPLASAIFKSGQRAGPSTSLSLFLKGTNFQLRVWSALLRIPEGAVSTLSLIHI